MSVDIHFAAYVSVSEIASSGSPRDARNPFTSATRPASEASSEAASAWPAGIAKPLPMAAIARIVLTNLRKADLPNVPRDRPTEVSLVCAPHNWPMSLHRGNGGYRPRVTCPLPPAGELIQRGYGRGGGGRRS